MAHDVHHDYHLVNPSPWPLVGSIGFVVLALGGVAYMKGLFGLDAGSLWYTLPGFGMIAITMIGWWGDVIKESKFGDHTPIVQIGLRYGMILFIVSEVMFFVAWFWSFFELTIFAHLRVGDTWDYTSEVFAEGLQVFETWPPKGVAMFDPFHLPLLNTLILLLSGTTITAAHHALQHGKRKHATNMLGITIVLGLVFSVVQAIEYSTAGFSPSSLYGSTFFMATGFHGAHVVIGTIFLIVCWIRLLRGDFTPQKHFGFEAAAWYWHFVDVVWLFLFAFVYVVPYVLMG